MLSCPAAGPAQLRELAAKHARLAAIELETLSQPAAVPSPTKSSWSFVSRLGTLLVNQLQLQIEDVSLRFQACTRLQ